MQEKLMSCYLIRYEIFKMTILYILYKYNKNNMSQFCFILYILLYDTVSYNKVYINHTSIYNLRCRIVRINIIRYSYTISQHSHIHQASLTRFS